MSKNSEIEWCHHTFNAWWGCVEVSPECDNCYARGMDARFPILGQTHWGKDAPRRFFGDKHWAQLRQWNEAAKKAGEQQRVFVNSMADIMEDRRDLDEHRIRLWNEIEQCDWLTFLLLSKRPQTFMKLLPNRWIHKPRPNVWGLTTVGLEASLWRIAELLKTPFTVRGLSMEPLLGPVVLPPEFLALGQSAWTICGGESGPKARPSHPAWFRGLRDQCQAAGVAFFFKQWGAWEIASHENGHYDSDMAKNGAMWVDIDGSVTGVSSMGLTKPYAMIRVGKKTAGRLLDGVEHNEFPEVRR